MNSFVRAAPLLFGLLALPAAHSAPLLVINSAFTAPLTTPAQDGVFDQLMIEAFRRVGRAVRIETPPAERGLINANEGIDDGDGPRIESIDQQYSNLVRVPEPLFDLDFVAFSEQDIPIDGWQSLLPYDVAIVRGWKILEANLAGVHSLVRVRTPELLFRLLANHRADVVVIERMIGQSLVHSMNLTRVRALSPSLAIRRSYLYLNRKHADLVPALATALSAMKQDGTFARIFARAGLPVPAEQEPR